MNTYNPYTGGNFQGQSTTSTNNFYKKPEIAVSKINGLELILVIICVIAVIGVSVYGFNVKNAQNRDEQRGLFIREVTLALDEYYKNSSRIPSDRNYPKSVCSGDLNEVDFELTLRNHLTGLVPEKDNHAYIDPQKFPSDTWGSYVSTFESRPFAHRCAERLNLGKSGQIYYDSRNSCLFKPSLGYNKCFLYNSVNGDSYQIGYFSESTKQFIVFEKFRDQEIKKGVAAF